MMSGEIHACQFGSGFNHIHTRVFTASIAIVGLLVIFLVASLVAVGFKFVALFFFALNLSLTLSVIYGNRTKNRYYYWPAIVIGRVYVIVGFCLLTYFLIYSFMLQYDFLDRMGQKRESAYDLKFDERTGTLYESVHPQVNFNRIRLLSSMLLMLIGYVPLYVLHRAVNGLQLGYMFLKMGSTHQTLTPLPHAADRKQNDYTCMEKGYLA